MKPTGSRLSRRWIGLGVFLLWLAAQPVRGGQGADTSQAFRQARELHLRGAAGDEEAAEKALELLEELVRESPNDPLTLAYLGSAKLLEAKRAWLPWRKQALGEEGLGLLDQAVAGRPANLEIRFLRGMSSYPLPSLFGRGKQAAEDFAFVAERAGRPDKGMEARVAAGACYYHGLCLEETGRGEEARAYWKRAVKLSPGSDFARAAAGKIQGED